MMLSTAAFLTGAVLLAAILTGYVWYVVKIVSNHEGPFMEAFVALLITGVLAYAAGCAVIIVFGGA